MPLSLRIYYEDTDAAGIVYYANYLRFLERGRTELLRSLGHEQSALATRRDALNPTAGSAKPSLDSPIFGQQIAFAVRSVQAEYLKPAKLDDLIVVETVVESVGRAQVMFSQQVTRDGEPLLDARIRVACIDPLRGKPVPMPSDIYQQLKSLVAQPAA
ncbi:MAG: hotdog domain-containing protein [Stagnimonas sp.]|nr:hotdog domain-containing protein [Stagnimonas sp.]